MRRKRRFVAVLLLLLACFGSRGQAQVSSRKNSTSTEKVFDLRVEGASAGAVVSRLRAQCAAVSFLESSRLNVIHLDLRQATVATILSRIADQDPAYRAERIAGRDVLFPSSPEFQVVLSKVALQELPRQEALEKYLARLNAEVPGFRDLLPQVIFGYSKAPEYTDRVSLRSKGRVIEHFVDLLGENPGMYFELGQARSGLPTLEYEAIKCRE